MKRNIPVSGNTYVSYGITWLCDGAQSKEPNPFSPSEQHQRAWRVSLLLEDRFWCIPMVFASQQDATIAALSIAPYFSECQTREDGLRVVEERGHAWLRARLTENLRW